MDSLFLEIDNIIKKKLNIENETSTDLYKDPSYRKQCSEIISEIVNTYIPKVEPIHDIFLEEKLKENGCVILENFINESEVDEIIDLIKLKPGYNYHIAASSYNQETKIFSENIDWNILSYKPEVFLKSDLILKKIADRSLLSLVQSYLQCFPTFY